MTRIINANCNLISPPLIKQDFCCTCGCYYFYTHPEYLACKDCNEIYLLIKKNTQK